MSTAIVQAEITKRFECRILPTNTHVFFIARDGEEIDGEEILILYAAFTFTNFQKYLEENFSFRIEKEEVSSLGFCRVAYNDDKYWFYFKAKELEAYVKIQPLKDPTDFAKLYAALDKKMRNDVRDIEQKYDAFYKKMMVNIDDVLALWEENSLSHNDRTNWSKHFDYTKKDFINNMFWWESRNRFIEDQKNVEFKEKRKAAELETTRVAANTNLPGLRLVRQVRRE